jgi:hypothetical protein
VNEYHISSGLWGLDGVGIARIGVITHELAHFLGLPDMYDRDGGGRGIGTYGLMGNAWGWDGTQYYPPHMSAWSKLALGWTTAVKPVEGINTIEATQVSNPTYGQVYWIQHGFPEGEFLLIENRQRIGYDKHLPQTGLLIWHVDYGLGTPSDFRKSLNTEGFPGQEGWPKNGYHYGVSLLQADGLYDLERGADVGDKGDFFHGLGVDELIPCQDSTSCQYPNTDAYQGGVITRTNNFITDISVTGNVMTFRYHVGSGDDDSSRIPTSSPSSTPTSPEPTTEPTMSPTFEPSSSPTATPSFTPTSYPTDAPSGQPSWAPSDTPSNPPSLCVCTR